MKPNISLIDSLCRITAGLTILAWSTAQLTKRQSSSAPILIAMLGSMKVAEGITRFCPLVYMAKQKIHHVVEEENSKPQPTNDHSTTPYQQSFQ
ncbi:YgaP family membrane protein [Halalkalibacter hemicellulosilyticus]|uniref:Inner membrane protein YgaP-like transmembrane domain-containing protein n=1 Tax=Halalkalibacter hemicellulosilyticusJCM 9152 TaxID=1236971 RepID=W4QCV3_9BACI|nr:DUF2892 domain-containing protein [Halalkalibacter hemicellulosilyticus]GAE29493.1 hypothetical protein JCM9152_854 [Halalkalibacter hemicellulosilyticusJCM 9152]